MPVKRERVGKPDAQVLEQFFDGTLPTPAERETKAVKMSSVQKAQNVKAAAKVNRK